MDTVWLTFHPLRRSFSNRTRYLQTLAGPSCSIQSLSTFVNRYRKLSTIILFGQHFIFIHSTTLPNIINLLGTSLIFHLKWQHNFTSQIPKVQIARIPKLLSRPLIEWYRLAWSEIYFVLTNGERTEQRGEPWTGETKRIVTLSSRFLTFDWYLPIHQAGTHESLSVKIAWRSTGVFLALHLQCRCPPNFILEKLVRLLRYPQRAELTPKSPVCSSHWREFAQETLHQAHQFG